MEPYEEERAYIIRLLRQFMFAGSGRVATISIPAPIKNVAKLEKGDSVEFVFDVRDKTRCTLIFKKKADLSKEGTS